MALIHSDDLDAIVAIGNIKDEHLGTGFFYASRYEDGGIPFLVTNGHVIEELLNTEQQEMRLKYFSYKDNEIYSINFALFDDDDDPTFYSHPTPGIDITVFPVNWNIIEPTGVSLLGPNISCDIGNMKKIGISEGDPIFVPGFPMPNSNVINKSVIVRKGSIARIRDVYNGKSDNYLIDALIFPGNSGAPVFSVPYFGSVKGPSINATRLLGVVKDYLLHEETAISTRSREERLLYTENSGLAIVHPMDYVEEVINIHKKRLNFVDNPKSKP